MGPKKIEGHPQKIMPRLTKASTGTFGGEFGGGDGKHIGAAAGEIRQGQDVDAVAGRDGKRSERVDDHGTVGTTGE